MTGWCFEENLLVMKHWKNKDTITAQSLILLYMNAVRKLIRHSVEIHKKPLKKTSEVCTESRGELQLGRKWKHLIIAETDFNKHSTFFSPTALMVKVINKWGGLSVLLDWFNGFWHELKRTYFKFQGNLKHFESQLKKSVAFYSCKTQQAQMKSRHISVQELKLPWGCECNVRFLSNRNNFSAPTSATDWTQMSPMSEWWTDSSLLCPKIW